MTEPRERERRLVEIRQALDESDHEERREEDSDVEAMAERWEKTVEEAESSDGS